MRTTLGLAAIVLLALPAALHAADVSPGHRPNILWITAEDISPNLACDGDPDAATPNLDSFASQGVRFDNCFSVHPCCSRAGHGRLPDAARYVSAPRQDVGERGAGEVLSMKPLLHSTIQPGILNL